MTRAFSRSDVGMYLRISTNSLHTVLPRSMSNIYRDAGYVAVRKSIYVVGLCALACLMSASCARQTEIVKLYDDSAAVAKSYHRFLVIDISSDTQRQQEFEGAIVDELRRERAEAIAGYPKLDASGGVQKGEIAALSEEFRADAILVTHMAGIDTRADIEPGKERLISTCRRGDPLDYFLYDHEVLKEPDSVSLAHTVMVVTNLYDAATQERVWAIQSTCFDKASMAEAMLDESHAIVRQLKIDELIR